jgi:hypothetical protein
LSKPPSAKSLNSWLGCHLVRREALYTTLITTDLLTESLLFESNRRAGFAESLVKQNPMIFTMRTR